MPRTSLYLAAIVVTGLAIAAPVPETCQVEPLKREQADAYAAELLRICRAIQIQYVRPVTTPELCAQALTGLYQAAALAEPEHLAADLQAASEPELPERVAQFRAAAGNSEILRDKADILVSCRAMCRCLDPYCVVLTGSDLASSVGRERNSGVGLDVHDNGGCGPVSIRLVVPGSPAQRAGLIPGDAITHLDGVALQDAHQSSDEVLQRLNSTAPSAIAQVSLPGAPSSRNEPAGPACLTIRKGDGTPPFNLKLEGELFQPESILGVRREQDNRWNYWADRDRHIALLRIGALSAGTADELAGVVSRLQEAELKGIVLDLRWCPGGTLSSAVEIAGLFLKKGTIAIIRSRKDGEHVYKVEPDPDHDSDRPKFLDVPMIVLIGADSSGGAELIAAALQDHERAIIAGQRTLGKGSVQMFIPLPPANAQGTPAALKLTSATFIRPNGKPLQRSPGSKLSDDWGVQPDPGQEWRISSELSHKLRDWWLLQTLRPGSSARLLPLDDPEADVQCLQAVKLLAGRLR